MATLWTWCATVVRVNCTPGCRFHAGLTGTLNLADAPMQYICTFHQQDHSYLAKALKIDFIICWSITTEEGIDKIKRNNEGPPEHRSTGWNPCILCSIMHGSAKKHIRPIRDMNVAWAYSDEIHEECLDDAFPTISLFWYREIYFRANQNLGAGLAFATSVPWIRYPITLIHHIFKIFVSVKTAVKAVRTLPDQAFELERRISSFLSCFELIVGILSNSTTSWWKFARNQKAPKKNRS
jgi:hypothetical protein